MSAKRTGWLGKMRSHLINAREAHRVESGGFAASKRWLRDVHNHPGAARRPSLKRRGMSAAKTTASILFLLRINRQKGAIAEGSFETFDRAVLVAASACAATDADGTDHFAVDHDGNAA